MALEALPVGVPDVIVSNVKFTFSASAIRFAASDAPLLNVTGL
jgi:hypothetical protein